MLLAVVMAADLLGFTVLNELIATLTAFLAQVVFGVIVIAAGIFIANFVARIMQSGGKSSTTATLVRVFIIILAVAIGLRAMGFANDLILLSFGLMLGAVAVAAAIAFGLGGRKAAGQIVERWTKPKVKDSNQSEETQ
jgi:small-conductance mechanosensitive channel